MTNSSMKKSNPGKRALVLLLTVILFLANSPIEALADGIDGLNVPPVPYESTNDVYAFGGKEYKVLSNGYISCYVSMEDGGFTVLPAAASFDPDKPASYASFRINGKDIRYGDTSNGEVVIAPEVENGVMETLWTAGDFVISQVHTIRQDEKHNNAWAVSVAYVAEYFGDEKADVSARLLLDTHLGENDDLPLSIGDTGEQALCETIVSPVPEYLFADDSGRDNAFLLNYELTDEVALVGFPQFIAVGSFTEMVSNLYDVQVDTAREMAGNDSGAAVFFGQRNVTACTDEDPDNSVAVFKCSYGFSDMKHVSDDTLQANVLALPQGNIEIGYYYTDEWFKDSNPFPIRYASAGDTVTFSLEPKYPEAYTFSDVKLEWMDSGSGSHQIDLTPETNGGYTYSFTVPEDIYLFDDDTGACLITFNMIWQSGYMQIGLNNFSAFSPELITSRPLGDTMAVVATGETIKVQVNGVNIGDAMEALPTLEATYTDESETFLSVPLTGQKTGTDSFGDIYEFDFTIPETSSISEGINISVSDGYQFTITRRIVPSDATLGIGDKVVLFVDAPLVNGVFRSNFGATVRIDTNVPADNSGKKIVVVNPAMRDENGVVAPGGVIKTINSDQFQNPDEMQFEMPLHDVEIMLEIDKYHPISMEVFDLTANDGNGAVLGKSESKRYVNAKVFPELPAPNQDVTVTFNFFEGAKPDPINNVVSAYKTGEPGTTVIISDISSSAITYQFRMPDHPVTLSVRTIIPPEPEECNSIYLKPLTGEGKVIADFANFKAYYNQWGLDLTQNMIAPKDARIEFKVPNMTNSSASDAGYTVRGVYLVRQSGERVPLNGYGSYSFTMPAEPVTLTIEGYKNPKGITLAQKTMIDGNAVIIGTPPQMRVDVLGVKGGWGYGGAEYPGKTVRVYLQTPKGYIPQKVEVLDENGQEIEVSYEGYASDGRVTMYSFVMGDANATVTGWYEKSAGMAIYVEGFGSEVKVGNGKPGFEGRTWDAGVSSDTYSTSSLGYFFETEIVLMFEQGKYRYELVPESGLVETERGQTFTKYKYKNPNALNKATAPFDKTFRIEQTENKQNIKINGVFYEIETAKFNKITLYGEGFSSFNPLTQLYRFILDETALDKKLLTVIDDNTMVVDLSGKRVSSGSHFFELSWKYASGYPGQDAYSGYSFGFKLADADTSPPPKDAKYLGIVNGNYGSYSLISGLTKDEMEKKAAGYPILLWMTSERGFQSSQSGYKTTWSIVDNSSTVVFSNGLTAGASNSIASGVTPRFEVIYDSAAQSGYTGVKISMDGFGMMASSIPIFTPLLLSHELTMDLVNGKGYETTMPKYPSIDTSNAPTFKLTGDAFGLDLSDFGGFKAEYRGIKYLTQGIDLSGELSLQLPKDLASGPMAGIDIENLVLGLYKNPAAFEGIVATGQISMPSIMIFDDVGGGGKAYVNTFEHRYEFEVNADIKMISLEGLLKLGVSQRLTDLNGGGPIVVPDEFYFKVGIDPGIPLIPGTQVASIKGAEGGIKGIIGTVDLQHNNLNLIPPLKVTAGGTFSLVELIEFNAKFELGFASYRAEMSGSIDLKGVEIPFFKEVVTEFGIKDVPPQSIGNVYFPARLNLYYYTRLSAALLKNPEFITGGGYLNIDAYMINPLELQGKTFTSANDFLNQMKFSAHIQGGVHGKAQIPQFSLLIFDFGPYVVASAEANIYGSIAYNNGITLTALKVDCLVENCVAYAAFNYDFLSRRLDWSAGLRTFASGSDALYSEIVDDGYGRITFGNGLRLVADTEGSAVSNSTMLRSEFGIAGIEDSLTISVSPDQRTHTVSVPDDGKYSVLATAPKDKLFVFDPDGNPYAINIMPTAESTSAGNAPTAEQARLAYNAIESNDGHLFISFSGKQGDWTIVSNEPFRTLVFENTAKLAAVSDVAFAGDSAVTFSTSGLEDGRKYAYSVFLENKLSSDALPEDSYFIGNGEFTADGADKDIRFEYDFSNSDFADSIPTGEYYPRVILYTEDEVIADQGLDFSLASEPMYEQNFAASATGGEPLSNTNTKYSNSRLGLLGDLAVTYGGNGTMNVQFSHPNTLPDELGEVSYKVKVYHASDIPALQADGSPIEIDLPLSKLKNDKYDFNISGLEAEKEYYVEVTPIFCYTGSYSISGNTQTQTVTTIGNAEISQPVFIKTPAPPIVSMIVNGGTIENGKLYARSGAELIITVDQSSDIRVEKYIGYEEIQSASGTMQMTLPLNSELSSKLITVSARNADNDTTTEFINVTILDFAPPLVIDVPASGVITSFSDGSYIINGKTSPHIWVSSSTGDRVESGDDGSFALKGILTDNIANVYLMVSDKAGNSETASAVIVKGTEDARNRKIPYPNEASILTIEVNGLTISVTKGSDGIVHIHATEEEIQKIIEASKDGHLVFDISNLTDVTGVLFEFDPAWFNNAEVKTLCLSLKDIGSVKVSDKMLKKLMNLNKKIQFSIKKGSLVFDILADGKSIGWYDYETPILVSLPVTDTNSVMKNIPRSWVSNNALHGFTYATGRYEAITASPRNFADTEGKWMNPAAQYMSARGVVAGIGNNLFAPERNVTRAEFVTMLINALNIEPQGDWKNTTQQFSDVAEGKWYYDGLLRARALGIISGVGNNMYTPDATVTRQDMFLMLYNAMSKCGLVLPVTDAEEPMQFDPFKDNGDLSAYARKSMATFIKEGMVSGKGDGALEPKGLATRAEAAQIIYNMLLRDVK